MGLSGNNHANENMINIIQYKLMKTYPLAISTCWYCIDTWLGTGRIVSNMTSPSLFCTKVRKILLLLLKATLVFK